MCKSAIPGHPSVENQAKEKFLAQFLADNVPPDYVRELLENALDVARKEMIAEASPATW